MTRLEWCEISRLITSLVRDGKSPHWTTERTISGRWRNSVPYCNGVVSKINGVTAMYLNCTDDTPWWGCVVIHTGCIDASAHDEKVKRRYYLRKKTRPDTRVKLQRRWMPRLWLARKWRFLDCFVTSTYNTEKDLIQWNVWPHYNKGCYRSMTEFQVHLLVPPMSMSERTQMSKATRA